MFCYHCGKYLEDGSNFCPYCGAPQQAAPAAPPAPFPEYQSEPEQPKEPESAPAPAPALPAAQPAPQVQQTAAPQPQAAPTEQKPISALGLAGFITSLVGMLFYFFLAELFFLFEIVALVLSSIAVANRRKYRLNGFGIAGISISAGLLFIVLIIILYVAIVYSVFYFGTTL